MSEHLSQAQLEGYREHTLEPHELLQADRHLASCDLCHERLASMRAAVAKPDVNPSSQLREEPFHLDYEQHLEPYVDGKADDVEREIVDSHVAECSRCADELRDLLAFKEQPAAAITAHAASRQRRWLPQWRWLPKPALAMALVIAVFILAIAALWWTTSLKRASQQAQTNAPGPDQQQKEQPSPSPAAPTPSREEPLVVLNDAGGQVILNHDGHLEGLQELPPDLRETVQQALATRRLRASPALSGWPTGAGRLRSEFEKQSTFAPLDPTDVVIETDRPMLRWRALEDASQYVVTVFDAKLRPVASSGPITDTQWTTPNSLARGVTYSWQISALKDGKTVVTPKPPLPEARFRILDQPAAAALAKLKKSAGSSHLAMGVFYWKHGLIEESRREFQALAKANPNSPAAAELLASIQSHRRR